MVEYWNNVKKDLDKNTIEISFFIFRPIIPVFHHSI